MLGDEGAIVECLTLRHDTMPFPADIMFISVHDGVMLLNFIHPR
jgi:hypothetical protein